MKVYQFCILTLLLINQSFMFGQQNMDNQQAIQQKETTPAWKKAAKWFGAIGLAAVSTVVLYQGAQFGHSKYIESKYGKNPTYQKYAQEWENQKRVSFIGGHALGEFEVNRLLKMTYTPEDLDMAVKVIQAYEGLLFTRTVQKNIAQRKELIKDLQKRQASW